MANAMNESDLLGRFLATRSPELREELVLRYISLVHYVLGRLGISQSFGGDYEDLVNQGLLGLIEAVDRYDPSFNTQFSTYATFRIRGKVLDYLRSLDWLSRTARHRTRDLRHAISTLSDRYQRPPTDAELAEYLGMDLPKVQQALVDSSRVLISLDSVLDLDDESENSLYETLADEAQNDPSDLVDQLDMKERLIEAIKKLPEREQTVLALYYYEELTLNEIGEVLGVSESRACQLHARAVLNLQAILTHEVTRG